MSSRLRAIARDTVTIIERGRYRTDAGTEVDLSADVASAIAGTRLYLPDDELPGSTPQPVRTVSVEVTRETTLEAARRLGGNAACLVFASAKNPGGGFLTGAQAQEESLARASALYGCLTAVPEFYAFHRAQGDLRYSHRVIYSPGVPVFRDDKGAVLDEPHRVAFLTAAAPNAGAIRRNQPASADSVPEMLVARAERVLRVAAAHGERRLVLGAWGCGVFQNDPHVVAEAFGEALTRCTPFDEVVFAVRDRQTGSPTFAAFARHFNRSAESGI